MVVREVPIGEQGREKANTRAMSAPGQSIRGPKNAPDSALRGAGTESQETPPRVRPTDRLGWSWRVKSPSPQHGAWDHLLQPRGVLRMGTGNEDPAATKGAPGLRR